jgi:phenylalanyl-tRNA synthetase beta subunit
LRFRSDDRTLTDDDIAALRRACVDAVTAAYDAELRA